MFKAKLLKHIYRNIVFIAEKYEKIESLIY
jgi:hypothetical protein